MEEFKVTFYFSYEQIVSAQSKEDAQAKADKALPAKIASLTKGQLMCDDVTIEKI